MCEECISRGQLRPYRKGGTPALPNFEVHSIYAWHPSMQNYQIWRGNIYGKGLVLGVSHASTPRGRVPALPNFGGAFLFMRTSFVAELPAVTW